MRAIRLLFLTGVLAVAVAAVALAVTPATGQFVGGGAKVQVLPGAKTMYVYLGVDYQKVFTSAGPKAAVKISQGRFSYNGSILILVYKPKVHTVPAHGTFSGRFITPKKLTLSYKVTKGNFKASKDRITLKLWSSSQS